MARMTIAQAVRELEVAAETGKLAGEAVATVRDALTLRESARDRKAWRDKIVRGLEALRMQPADVLVLRLPAEVIADPDQMRAAQAAARDIAQVAKRAVVLLQEGAPLTAEHVAPPPEPSRLQVVRTMPTLRTPGR